MKIKYLGHSQEGWVKRDIGTIYVGFAYLIAPQKFEIETKLANLSRLVVTLWFNPTIYRFGPRSGYPIYKNLRKCPSVLS
jgi:hypothetical protein